MPQCRRGAHDRGMGCHGAGTDGSAVAAGCARAGVPGGAGPAARVPGERMVIAERHPDLRACLPDQVVFLAGGTRVLPLATALAVRTVEQSDALVAQLR